MTRENQDAYQFKRCRCGDLVTFANGKPTDKCNKCRRNHKPMKKPAAGLDNRED